MKSQHIPQKSGDYQEQLEKREGLKKKYVELGGTLRPAIENETAKQSITRNWQLGIDNPIIESKEGDKYAVRPPSPRRNLDDGLNDAMTEIQQEKATQEMSLQQEASQEMLLEMPLEA